MNIIIAIAILIYHLIYLYKALKFLPIAQKHFLKFFGIMASSCIIAVLFALFLGTSWVPSKGALPVGETKSTEFIRHKCGGTSFPGVCFRSLSVYASKIKTSPMQMASTALSVSLVGARSTSAMIAKLSAGHHGRGEAAAMQDCIDEIADSVDELRESMAEMGHLAGRREFDRKMNDIETWVSAALTDEDTCMDGFEEMDSKVKEALRGRLVKVAKLTSNALALINGLAATGHAVKP